MNSELNEKIKQAHQGCARLQKIDSMLEQLESDQRELEGKSAEWKAIMEKEQSELEKLENGSIASFFYSMLGNLEEQVSKERKEALAAKLKQDQLVRDLDYVNVQISELTAERITYKNCEKDYKILFAEKREALISQNGAIAEKILDLITTLNLADSNHKEIQEAIAAGERVLSSLDNALDSLGSAEGWGVWDMFGGGLISDLAKHSHIDDAKSETEHTQRLLQKFKTELTDIKISADIMIETDGFAKFADFFFDGLIADWFMQSRINESQESVYTVKEQVQNILEKLEQMEQQEKDNLEKYEKELDELVLKG